MFMLLTIGNAKDSHEYVVKSLSFSLNSRGEYEKFDDCDPGEISMSIAMEPTEENNKPGKLLFSFASDQSNKSVKELSGKIQIFAKRGQGRKGAGKPYHIIDFNHAWISGLSTGFGEGEKSFNIHLNILAGEVSIAGEKFKDDDRFEYVDKNAQKG